MKLNSDMLDKIHEWITADASCTETSNKITAANKRKRNLLGDYYNANRDFFAALERGIKGIDYRLSLVDRKTRVTALFSDYTQAHRKIWVKMRQAVRSTDAELLALNIKLAKRQGYLRSHFEESFMHQMRKERSRQYKLDRQARLAAPVAA